MAPQFEAAGRASAGQFLFAKLDTEAAPQTAARLGIRSIPTMIAFAGGREVARQSGAMSQAQIQQWLATITGHCPRCVGASPGRKSLQASMGPLARSAVAADRVVSFVRVQGCGDSKARC